MKRIRRIQERMIEKNIDVVLLFSLNEIFNSNVFYLTSYKGLGILAILQKDSFLVVPEMEYEKAKKSKIRTYKAKKKLLQCLGDLIEGKKINKIGINEHSLSLYQYKRLEDLIKGDFVDVSEDLSKIRLAKDKAEISKIKKACNVTDKVYRNLVDKFKFDTENDLKLFIESEIKKQGCQLAFDPIVASGKNSSFPHYDRMDSKIKKGFLLLDFGAKYKGYCSDMTRMLYLGNPDEDEKKNFELVLKTLKRCEAAVLEKKDFAEISKIADKELGKKKKYFTHSLGHGLGIEIHEEPKINDEKTEIKNNIPFTLEPGIYLPGKYGIRIEDTVILEHGRLVILTESKKELQIIPS